MRLKEWFRRQTEREDAVGDLARDVVADHGWPRGCCLLRTAESYLEMRGASPEAISALHEAWGEYLIWRLFGDEGLAKFRRS